MIQDVILDLLLFDLGTIFLIGNDGKVRERELRY